jgi:signal transduction histidine kinase
MLFYSVLLDKMVEIVYPLALSAFVYLIYMIYQYYRYKTFSKQLKGIAEYKYFQVELHGCQEQEIYEVIQQLHTKYLNEMNEIVTGNVNEKRFLSSWIHNMKTPVTVNDLLIQRVQQQEISPEVAIAEIKEENDKILNHLNMILEMNRLSEFSKDYVPQQLDLIEQVKDIINKNRKLFIYNRVFPKFYSELKEAVVLSDKKWNELMITQLISNAVKYSKDEEKVKNLYFTITLEEGRIVLQIKDEGIGIPEADIKKVFLPFFTGENGRKNYSASGIGLYLCKEISNMLGHDIQIKSKIKEGTQVTLTYLTKL